MPALLRRAGVVGAVLALSATLVVGAGVLIDPPAERSADRISADRTGGNTASDPLSRSIAVAQERLGRVPRDWQAWAGLGSSYVEQARVTADPSFYDLAAGALAKSLEIEPTDNSPALTGLAALAAARRRTSPRRRSRPAPRGSRPSPYRGR